MTLYKFRIKTFFQDCKTKIAFKSSLKQSKIPLHNQTLVLSIGKTFKN